MFALRRLTRLLGILLLLHAHAAAQAPIPVQNVMSMLLEPPFYGQFVKVEQRPGGSVAVITCDDGQSYEFQSFGNGEQTSALLMRAQIGRRVVFPQVFFDLMGSEMVLNTVRSLSGRSFAERRDDRPFRAQVLDQGIGRLTYSIVLREAGGRLHHVHGMLDDGINRHTAKLLKKGGWFEFPAIIQDAGLTDQARADKRKPTNHLNEVLQRYIGRWKGHTKAVSYVTLRMTCQWEASGDGIWREITYEHAPDVTPPPVDIARVSYSAASGCYLAWNPAKDALNFRISWDEPTKTFTTEMAADEEGVERFNTAMFVDDDHIEWKTFSKLADGRVLEMNSGSYERVSRDPEPAVTDAEPWAIDVLAGQIIPIESQLPVMVEAHKPDPNRPDLPIYDKPSDAPVMEVVDATLAGLAVSPPFRARLISKSIQPHNITLELEHTSGHRQTISDKGYKLAEKPEALPLASLKEGEVHDFPDCLTTKASPGPLTPAIQALAPLAGTWAKTIRTREGKLEPVPCIVRFFAASQGNAFWQEESMSGRPKLQRISFDEKEQVYVSAPEHVKADPRAVQGRWDEKTSTFTQVRHFMNAPPGAVREESTLRIASADQIEWRTRLISKDESIAHESSGTLERVKP